MKLPKGLDGGLKAISVFGVLACFFLAGLTPALAALDAKLSASHGHPGDTVILTTDDSSNPGAYLNLAREDRQPVYLVSTTDFEKQIARSGFQVCGTPEQRFLGRLTWDGGTGSLIFRIPDVRAGDYYFQLGVQKGCWRIGSSSAHPLLLDVTAQSGVHDPLGFLILAGFVVVVSTGLLVAVGRGRSKR